MEKYLDLGYQTRGFSVAKEHLTSTAAGLRSARCLLPIFALRR